MHSSYAHYVFATCVDLAASYSASITTAGLALWLWYMLLQNLSLALTINYIKLLRCGARRAPEGTTPRPSPAVTALFVIYMAWTRNMDKSSSSW